MTELAENALQAQITAILHDNKMVSKTITILQHYAIVDIMKAIRPYLRTTEPDPKGVKALLKDVYFHKASTEQAFLALEPYLCASSPARESGALEKIAKAMWGKIPAGWSADLDKNAELIIARYNQPTGDMG